MVAFAQFVLRDNGLPVHLSVDFVTQVRVTPEAEGVAIYISGKETPVLVEGTLDGVMRKIALASAGVKLVEPEPAPPPPPVEYSGRPYLEIVSSKKADEDPAKPKARRRKAAAKPAAKAKASTQLAKVDLKPGANDEEDERDWFKGLT